MTSCGCLLLEKVEDNGGEAAARGSGKIAPAVGCGYCTGKWKSRSEAIFPIYVMGSSRPSTVAAARSIVDSVGDPIWDAVKAEAKSEVSVLPNLARAARLEHHLRRLRLRPPLPRALSSSLATAAPPHARFSAPASSAPLHERSAAETMETTTKAMEAVAAAAAAAEKDERLRLEFAYLALLAQKAHRFEDALAAMCNVAKMGSGLTDWEMQLFSTYFNKLINEKFDVWNVAANLQQAKKEDEFSVKVAGDYRSKLENEIKETCCNVLNVLNKDLIPSSSDAEVSVHFQKMVADCHCILADVMDVSLQLMKNPKDYGTGAAMVVRMERKKAIEKSLEALESTWTLAKEKLPATNHVRLTLALDISTMFCKLESGARAFQLVNEAHAAAKTELKSRISSKETKELMRALKNKLTLLGSIDDGAYRRVCANQQQQFGWTEGVELVNNPVDSELKLSEEDEPAQTAQDLSASCYTSTGEEM